MGAVGFAGVVGVAGCGGYCRMWRVLQELSTEIKKSFFSFFTLTPALTLPSHFRHRKVFCQGFYLQNLTKVPEKYSCLVPTVQHRYTNSIAMFHYQYSYAALLVQGGCTFTGTIINLLVIAALFIGWILWWRWKPHKRRFLFPIFVINDTFREWLWL